MWNDSAGWNDRTVWNNCVNQPGGVVGVPGLLGGVIPSFRLGHV